MQDEARTPGQSQEGNDYVATLNVRLDERDQALIRECREQLQRRYGTKVRVTQRTVVIEALENLLVSLKNT